MEERHARAFDPPAFRSLASTPELQSVVVATFEEGLDWCNRSRPNTRHAQTAEPFSWQIVQSAAERAAAEHGIPLGALRAVFCVLDVGGLWSYAGASGLALCSRFLTADADALGLLLHDAFISGSS